ncbi:hypothetical protein NECAME_10230 [Necator americanus]|uniref:Uncharacterized protein n=1 Tax=Necator americanus TaxID=51031 RepID=W2TBM9_NECAM|nr:hypothetical protein NECAME_10230 [Necator americanus]ETN78601.1 hypothetical protein NECAME_10230 [Necator americanus]
MPREDRRRHVQLIIRGILQPNREQLAGTALAQLAAAILWNEWKIDMTRLRHYLSQAIGSAGGAKGAGPEELGADVTLLLVHLEHCRQTYSAIVTQNRLMQSPSPIYLAHWIHGGFLDPIIRLLQSAVDTSVLKKER